MAGQQNRPHTVAAACKKFVVAGKQDRSGSWFPCIQMMAEILRKKVLEDCGFPASRSAVDEQGIPAVADACGFENFNFFKGECHISLLVFLHLKPSVLIEQ